MSGLAMGGVYLNRWAPGCSSEAWRHSCKSASWRPGAHSPGGSGSGPPHPGAGPSL